MKTSRNKRSKLILVLGGAASGKSQAALDLAGRAVPRAFVATGEAWIGRWPCELRGIGPRAPPNG